MRLNLDGVAKQRVSVGSLSANPDSVISRSVSQRPWPISFFNTSQWSDQCPLSASRNGVELIVILIVTVQNCSQSYPIYPGSERVCQGEGFLQITCFWYLLSRIVFDQVFLREDAFWAPLQIESPSVDRQSVTSLDQSMVTTLTVVSVTILVPNRKFHVRHPVLSIQMCFRVSEFEAKKFTFFLSSFWKFLLFYAPTADVINPMQFCVQHRLCEYPKECLLLGDSNRFDLTFFSGQNIGIGNGNGGGHVPLSGQWIFEPCLNFGGKVFNNS